MIEENANNTHISFSEFSLSNECQHRHLLEKHLKIYKQPDSIHLYFGDSIHKTLENTIIKKLSIQERVEFFQTLFKKNMDEKMIGTEDYINLFPEFTKHGIEILKIFLFDKALDNYDVVCIEEQLYEKIYGNYYFKGFIDLVLRHKITKKYLIVDYKTSSMPWILKYKLADRIFQCQMKFYKFFYCRKHNIPLFEMDTTYTVLNRLKDKKVASSYPGPVQKVPINVNYAEIKDAMNLLGNTMKSIHIDKKFLKAKFRKNSKGEYNEKYHCKFCPLKGGIHELCNSDPYQYKELLEKYSKS